MVAVLEEKLLGDLREIRKSIAEISLLDDDVREQIRAEARGLMLDIERPDNSVKRVGGQAAESAMILAAQRSGLFKALVKHSSGAGVDVLAKDAGVDTVLAGRILRCLAADGAATQLKHGTFAPNNISKAFAERANEAAMDVYMDYCTPAWLKLPEYLASRDWKNPNDTWNTSLALANGYKDGLDMWSILLKGPTFGSFMEFMGTAMDGMKSWVDFYPVQERLIDGARTDPEATMMVDVGGGFGHHTASFKRKFPNAHGRLIVQDLPQGMPPPDKRAPGLEYMSHNFFEAQPIKGARLYYLHYIAHDWPNSKIAEICTNLRKVMEPGYSRLIINEWVLPETGLDQYMAHQDINMMSLSAGMEREEGQHREYLEAAGLKIVQIFAPGDKYSEWVIETEVA